MQCKITSFLFFCKRFHTSCCILPINFKKPIGEQLGLPTQFALAVTVSLQQTHFMTFTLCQTETEESLQLQAICELTLAEKQIGCSRTVDYDNDDSDWERSTFDAFNEMDE